MINAANGWANYYVGIIWLVVFAAFALLKYPHHERGSRE